MEAIRKFLEKNNGKIKEIRMVLYTDEAFRIFSQVFSEFF